MKDYTKYDFAAIVGAEVSILLKSKIEYGGTLKLISNKAIFLLMNDNPLALEGRWFSMEEITSLTAKIKVEDMTPNQLKRRFQFDCKYPVVLVNDKVFSCHINNEKIDAVCGEISIHDYIDCTDWGWKE